MVFKKIAKFIQSKAFVNLLLLIFLIVFSVLFWLFGGLIAFNENYLFSNVYLKIFAICIVWLAVFFVFFLKPFLEFLVLLKSDKKAQLKVLKKEANRILFRAKRNFYLALKDAKNAWKKALKPKNIPLFMVVGNEGSGKSTFINCSTIEYPLSDSLESHKKWHKSTTNFALYVSKNGALLDTSGKYFTQEELFVPKSSDELPEDDFEKNKAYLLQKNVWKNFLYFLNKRFFHHKLNGVILVVDITAFLNRPKEYSNDLIRHFVRRIRDCEQVLKLEMPLYVVFSKLDLLEGMGEYFQLLWDTIEGRAFGLSLDRNLNKKLLEDEFCAISQSLLFNFMQKNENIYSLEDRKRLYLFLKQLDNLFALIVDFLLCLRKENALKNASHLKGVYFVSAYQENVPNNFLFEAICAKYCIKKPLIEVRTSQNKQSYFTKSLLENIIFKDFFAKTIRNTLEKLLLIIAVFVLGYGVYSIATYFLNKGAKEVQRSADALESLEFLLQGLQYENLSTQDKALLLVKIKSIIQAYPMLNRSESFMQYLNLEIAYKGFIPVKKMYQMLNEDVLRDTILKEMEHILEQSENEKSLLKTLYVYESLFTQKYFQKELLKDWINENWKFLAKYQIAKEDFLNGVDAFNTAQFQHLTLNAQSAQIAIKKLQEISRIQRIAILVDMLNSGYKKEKYFLKDALGINANRVFSEALQDFSMDKIYTKRDFREFLKGVKSKLDLAILVEAWLFEGVLTSKESKNTISTGILRIYLKEYQRNWQNLLNSIAPVSYQARSAMLNGLEILSKVDNPLYALAEVVAFNTKLNDTTLLAEAYSLGFNAVDARNLLASFTQNFSAYHNLVAQNKVLDSKVLANVESKNNEKLMDIVSDGVLNLHNKVVGLLNDNTQGFDEKIAYVFGATKGVNDPFIELKGRTKNLPFALEQYYNALSLQVWGFLEAYGISLFNDAWNVEVYTPFINNIAPFYPFSKESIDDLNMDTFKDFFGRNGTLNAFHKKYFHTILIKKKDHYVVAPQFATRLHFSNEFLESYTKAMQLSTLLLSANDSIRVNFTLKSLDMSADFSHLQVGYGDKIMQYDHTLSTTLSMVGEQFSNGVSLEISAFNYANPNITYNKTYNGVWGWYRLIQTSKNAKGYSVIFDNDKKLYFDFTLTNGASEVRQIMQVMQNFKMAEVMMGTK